MFIKFRERFTVAGQFEIGGKGNNMIIHEEKY